MNLIERAKGDADAFIQLYDKYVERVYQYLLKRARSCQDAEDLSSQVWEKALQKISALKTDEEAGFLAWIFTIARNEVNQYFRKSSITMTDDEPEKYSDSAKSPEELAKQNFDSKLIKQQLECLPKKQRESIELKYFAGLRNKEIALVLKVSEKTVASNLLRGLEFLESSLKKLQ